jgi:hypothetical protein
MAIVGLLGDAHGNFNVIFDIIKNNPNVKRWFQVGDLGGESVSYPAFPSIFHFIQGNHENWDYIESLKKYTSPLFLRNGSVTRFEILDSSFSVGAFGGNYSSNAYTTPTNKLLGRKRRFFTSDDYDSLIFQDIRQKAKDKTCFIDILLTHEAPSPFKKSIVDIGVSKVTELIKKLTPKIHFFGHHHVFHMSSVGETPSIGLDRVTKSYVLYDTESNLAKKVDI